MYLDQLLQTSEVLVVGAHNGLIIVGWFKYQDELQQHVPNL